jgi:hypothetical protein
MNKKEKEVQYPGQQPKMSWEQFFAHAHTKGGFIEHITKQSCFLGAHIT